MIEWNDSEAEYVKGLLGIPHGYVAGQLDCIGVFVKFWRDHGLHMPDPAHQGSLGCSLSTSVLDEDFDPICKYNALLPEGEAPQYGDGVFLSLGPAAPDSHVGLWTPIGILHSARAGVVMAPFRRARVTAYFRPKEAANARQIR